MKNDLILRPGEDEYEQIAAMLANQSGQWNEYMTNCLREEDAYLVNHSGTLKFDDHIQTTEDSIPVREDVLVGVTDLISAGLTRSADLTDMLVRHGNRNKMDPAQRSMNPTMIRSDQTDYQDNLTPLPIIYKGWKIPFRQTGFAYKNSDGNQGAVRAVAESWEEMLFLGDSSLTVTVSGVTSQVYGYTNHPATSTTTISDWTNSANHSSIISDVLSMIQIMHQTLFVSTANNSIMMYVSNDVWIDPLADDYSVNKGDNTFLERIKKIPGIRDVKPAAQLPLKSVLMVEFTSETIQMAIASDIISIPYTRTKPMEDQKFVSLAAAVPIIKQDRNGITGILYATMT